MSIILNKQQNGHNVHGSRHRVRNDDVDKLGWSILHVHRGDFADLARACRALVRRVGDSQNLRTHASWRTSLNKKALFGFLAIGVLFCLPANAAPQAGGIVQNGVHRVDGTPNFTHENVVWKWIPTVDTKFCSFQFKAQIVGTWVGSNADADLHVEVGSGGDVGDHPSAASWTLNFAYSTSSPYVQGDLLTQNLGFCINANAGVAQWLRFTVDPVTPSGNYINLSYSDTDTYGSTTVFTANTVTHFYNATTKHPYGGFGGTVDISDGDFTGGTYATSITAVIPTGSLESGALDGYIAGTVWTVSATNTTSTVFQDKVNSFLGNSTGTFPMCIAYPWFTLVDFFVGNTTGTSAQSLTITGAGIVPTSTFSLSSFPDVLADINAKPVLDPLIVLVQSLAWLGFGLFIFRDIFGKNEEHE